MNKILLLAVCITITSAQYVVQKAYLDSSCSQTIVSTLSLQSGFCVSGSSVGLSVRLIIGITFMKTRNDSHYHPQLSSIFLFTFVGMVSWNL